MTKKEIEIQTALGTIDPHKLTDGERNHWLNIQVTRVLTNLNKRKNDNYHIMQRGRGLYD